MYYCIVFFTCLEKKNKKKITKYLFWIGVKLSSQMTSQLPKEPQLVIAG